MNKTRKEIKKKNETLRKNIVFEKEFIQKIELEARIQKKTLGDLIKENCQIQFSQKTLDIYRILNEEDDNE